MYQEKLLLSNKLLFLLSFFLLFLFLSYSKAEDTIKWSFVAYSDNNGSNPSHREILTSIAKAKPEIILHLGDAVDISKEYGFMTSFKKDVEECYGNFDDFVKIFYLAIGGHEERYCNYLQYPPYGKEPDNAAGKKFYDEINLKDRVTDFNDEYGDYYFRHKNVHFVILYRSDEWQFQKGQVKWLKGILERIKGKGPIVVAGHSGGWFYPIENNQKEIFKLLKKYNVDIILAADWHDYFADVYGNTMRFRSGSAGWGDAAFIKFSVTDREFIIIALNPDGSTLFGEGLDIKDQHPYWIKEFGKPGKKAR